MELPDYKALKKLAESCRKVGIKSFKSAAFEFTLTDDLPTPKKSAPKAPTGELPTQALDPETLDDVSLLFWSSDQESIG